MTNDGIAWREMMIAKAESRANELQAIGDLGRCNRALGLRMVAVSMRQEIATSTDCDGDMPVTKRRELEARTAGFQPRFDPKTGITFNNTPICGAMRAYIERQLGMSCETINSNMSVAQGRWPKAITAAEEEAS